MKRRSLPAALLAAALALPSTTHAQPAPAEPPATAPVPEAAETDAAGEPGAGAGANSGAEATAPEADAAAAPGLRGRITDATTGEGLIEATIKVTAGGSGSALTDIDGNYVLELPPGTYEVRVFYELYKARRIGNVIVRAGEPTVLDVALESDTGAVQEVVVEGKADRRSEGANLAARKKAPVVQDTVSAQEISRSPDSSAGDAVKRVVSATVVGGKYVFVRGLGGRYSIALLNGVPLPSPEPDTPAVPLDLFPASLLANLTVVKSYGAELPGTFSGGALLIETNAYPEAFELKLKLAGTFDSRSTWRDSLGYAGGSSTWLGFSAGDRALPDAVPKDGPLRVRDGMDLDELVRVGRAFPDVWNPRREDTSPNLSLGVSVGDTLEIGGGKRLGYLATLSYGKKFVIQDLDVASATIADGQIVARQQLATEIGIDAVNWGGLANVGLRLDGKNELSLFGLWSRAVDDRTQVVTGRSESDSTEIEGRRLQYLARQLFFGQLAGTHTFGGGALALRWQTNLSRTTRDEPDTRDLEQNLVGQRLAFSDDPGSGVRFYSGLGETAGGGGADLAWTRPGLTVRGGATVQRTSRGFDARRFRYRFVGDDTSIFFQDPEQLFAPSNIGPNFRLEERTLPADAYDASLTVVGGFVGADLTMLEPLRLVGGLRIERAAQALDAGSRFATVMDEVPPVERNTTSLLPTLNAVYALSPRMNVRAGASYTLARPQFRELAPFLFFDYVRRRAVSGNPDLVDTRIQNYDLRWELFPAEREVLAVSAFYKRFADPIETVIVSASNGDLSYTNTAGATVAGVELEARGSLGRFTPALRSFRGAVNVTLVHSEIDLGGMQGNQTNAERPLEGQSPYIVNLDFGWVNERDGVELSVLFNVAGERVAEVGVEGLPEVYEQPFARLDATCVFRLPDDWRLKLTGSNLLAQDVELRQGPLSLSRTSPGIAFGVSFEWAPKP